MKQLLFIFAGLAGACAAETSQNEPQTEIMDSADISFNDYVHETLPEDLLDRIKATVDIFEPIDGISYERAVDLYKRDFNPEENLVIWEQMAQAFTSFCAEGCDSMEKQKEVYRALLLISMFPREEVMPQLQPQILTPDEVSELSSLYALAPQPLTIIEK